MRKNNALAIAIIAGSVVSLAPVHAQDWQGRPGYEHWRNGNWYNGYHEGHTGWWWIVDGNWTYYPTPVYPYPDPDAAVPVEAAPIQADPSMIATAGTEAVHYYCTNPVGYYPTVPECNAEWQPVDASATDVVAEQSPQEVDADQLKSFSTAFDAIDPSGQQADTKLVQLLQQIESYRQSLYRRSYNAMSYLEQAEALQRRVTEMRDKVERSVAPAATAAPASTDTTQTPAVATQPPAAPQAAPETPVTTTPQY